MIMKRKMLFMGLFFGVLLVVQKMLVDRNDVENRLSILKQNYGIQYCRTDVLLILAWF